MSDITTDRGPDAVREAVRRRYAAAARQAAEGSPACCTPVAGSSCCADGTAGSSADGGTDRADPTVTMGLGGTDPITADHYAEDVAGPGLESALAASLGCGNPTALAALHPGERVLDLGSGGGLDVLLSARRVGPDGFAYGVDMTPEMLELARRHQREAGVTNAEFLQGTLEALPLPDAAVDVVISNCVVNLAADKDPVLAEAFRVLRPGGRFAVSDMVLTRPLPDVAQQVMAWWTGCVAGALVDADYLERLTRAGFADASIEVTRRYSRQDLEDLAVQVPPGSLPAGVDVAALLDEVDGALVSAFVRAVKPAA